MKNPKLQTKTYSFNDLLYQSFGNGPFSLNQNHIIDQNNKTLNISNTHSFPYNQEQIVDELFSISEKISLRRKLFKMNKPITSASVLMVNTQNKIKTEMLIQSKKYSQNYDSLALCQNANKYLCLLDTLAKRQIQNQFENLTTKPTTNQTNQNLESKIQEFHHFKAYVPSDEKIFESSKQQNQCKNEIKKNYKTNNSYSQQNSSLSLSENEKLFSSHPKSTQFTYNFQTAQKVFRKIQIQKNQQHPDLSPKSPIMNPQKNKIFSPIDRITSNNKYDLGYESDRKKQEGEFSTKKRQNFHNQKPKIPQNTSIKQKSPFGNHKKPRGSTCQDSILKNKNIKSAADLSKSNKSKLPITNQQKIQIAKEIMSNDRSKNLIIKTIDKTKEFQKMLKMASSRMNAE